MQKSQSDQSHMPLKQERESWPHTREHALSTVQTTGPPILGAVRALDDLDAIANLEVKITLGLRGKVEQCDDVVHRLGLGLESRRWWRRALRRRCRRRRCPEGSWRRRRGGVRRWGRDVGRGSAVCGVLARRGLTRAERGRWGRWCLL